MKNDRPDITRRVKLPDGGTPNRDESRSLTVAIVEEVSKLTGRDPIALPPLYHAVNPEALERLVRSKTSRDSEPVSISFTFEDIEVIVDSDGNLELRQDEQRTN